MSGSGADPDGDPITFSWTGPVSLSGAGTATPSFVAPDDGTFTFTLVVNDGTVNGIPDTVDVTVSNVAPTIFGVSASETELTENGGTSTIRVVANDPGPNDPLQYFFDCDDNGTFEVGPQLDRSNKCTYTGANRGTTTAVNVKVDDQDGGIATGCAFVKVPPVQRQWVLELEIIPDNTNVTGLSHLLLGVRNGCGDRVGFTAPALLPFVPGLRTYRAYMCPGQTNCNGVDSDDWLSRSIVPQAEAQYWAVEVTYTPPSGESDALKITFGWDKSAVPQDLELLVVDSGGFLKMSDFGSYPPAPSDPLTLEKLSESSRTLGISFLVCSQVPGSGKCPQILP